MTENLQPLIENKGFSSPLITPHSRLLSLDVFRGITVAAMILVNNPGDWSHIYTPLEHAEWNGCTPTDLVFPFFLFIVGVSIVYALGRKKELNNNSNKLIWTAAKRALVLFGLGLFLSLFPKVFTNPIEALQTVRIPGVLQRIAVVYFIASLIFIKTTTYTQFRILILTLVVYWALMTFVPVPGVGFANLEKETNLGAWLDRSLLGENHLWSQSKTWDPEGILSNLPAVATGLFGVLIGTLLKRKDKEDSVKVSWMFSVGLVSILLGLLWNLSFPINKALWTSSYVLYTAGWATTGLAFCYWLIDVNAYSRLTKPFVVYGVNAITVFFLSGIIGRSMNLYMVQSPDGKEISVKARIFEILYTPYFSPLNASFAYALSFVLIWLLILWWMYNKKLIVKV